MWYLRSPPGHHVWPNDLHEPLMIAIVLPYLRFEPWELRRTPKVLELAKLLSEMWESDSSSEGSVLQQLWSLKERMEAMPEVLARKVLFGKRQGEVPCGNSRKRQGIPMEKSQGQEKVSRCQKW